MPAPILPLQDPLPGDVQGDAVVSEVVNMAGSTQRCSGICRIKFTLSASWGSGTTVVNGWWNNLLLSSISWVVWSSRSLADAWPVILFISHFGIPELFSFFTSGFLALWLVKYFSGHSAEWRQPPHGVKQSSWSSSSKVAVLPEDFFLFFCQTSGSVWCLSFALLSQFPGLPFFWS